MREVEEVVDAGGHVVEEVGVGGGGEGVREEGGGGAGGAVGVGEG